MHHIFLKVCSDGWEQFNDKCYKGFPGLFSYAQAEDLCDSYGAIISPAESQEEFDFIGELQ